MLLAQWLNYPTPGVPRTPDGKPHRASPANCRANCGAECNDTQVGREFLNIAGTLKGGPPYKPATKAVVQQRSNYQNLDPNVHCMPRGAPRIWTDDYYKRI